MAMACLLSVVYAEARGESNRGKEAVAHVVLNRARETNRSVCQVVNESGQFKQKRPPRSFKINLSGKDPTKGATYFRTKDASSWLGYKKKIRIGNHTFYGK